MAQKGSNGTTAMGMETNPIYHANDSKYITHLDASIPLYSWRSRSSTFKTKWLYNNVFHQPKAKNKYTWRRWCWTSRFEERPICPPKNHRKKSHQLHGPHLRHESRTRGRTSVHQDATNGAAWLPIPDIPAMVGILGHQNIETPTDPRSWMFLYTVGNLHLYIYIW